MSLSPYNILRFTYLVWKKSNNSIFFAVITRFFFTIGSLRQFSSSYIPFSLVWWRWANFKKCFTQNSHLHSAHCRNAIVCEAVCIQMCVCVYTIYKHKYICNARDFTQQTCFTVVISVHWQRVTLIPRSFIPQKWVRVCHLTEGAVFGRKNNENILPQIHSMCIWMYWIAYRYSHREYSLTFFLFCFSLFAIFHLEMSSIL